MPLRNKKMWPVDSIWNLQNPNRLTSDQIREIETAGQQNLLSSEKAELSALVDTKYPGQLSLKVGYVGSKIRLLL